MVSTLISIYFDSLWLVHTVKIGCMEFQTVDQAANMLNFVLSEKGLGLVSLPHILYYFLRKIFFVQYSISWQSSLFDCHHFLRYWTVFVLQLFFFPVYDVRNFGINLSFLIKPKCILINILKTKRSFKVKWKTFVWLLKGFPSC